MSVSFRLFYCEEGGGGAMASQIGVRLLPPEWRLRFQAPKPIGEINKSNSRMNHFTVQ